MARKLAFDFEFEARLLEQKICPDTDEMLRTLTTIGVLVNTLPRELPINLTISTIFALFVQKDPKTLLNDPQKFYQVVRKFVLDIRK
ncbi:MAG: hypothetical protein ACFFC7_34270 [Candidatus Hermodarchaeota archaeon]